MFLAIFMTSSSTLKLQSINSQIKLHWTFICADSKSDTQSEETHNMTAHQLTQYY